MGKRKTSTGAAVIPSRPGIVVPTQARTMTPAEIGRFKEHYLEANLPVLREYLLAEPDPRESFDWQALFCVVKTAREAQGPPTLRGCNAKRGA